MSQTISSGAVQASLTGQLTTDSGSFYMPIGTNQVQLLATAASTSLTTEINLFEKLIVGLNPIEFKKSLFKWVTSAGTGGSVTLRAYVNGVKILETDQNPTGNSVTTIMEIPLLKVGDILKFTTQRVGSNYTVASLELYGTETTQKPSFVSEAL